MNRRIIEIKKEMDDVSPSFCAAKWLQTTLYLQTGWNHSCHHPAPHKIPLAEVEANPKALHNTQFKKGQMQKMLDGVRPSECDYCWNIEDLGPDHISDRTYKTAAPWASGEIANIVKNGTKDITPTYLEISFSHVCNLKCAYCSPDVSSKWLEEIEQFGPYPTSGRTGDLDWLKSAGRFPIPNKEYNPYVDAFWKWWPELSKNLETLRLTGGEPLLSKDVWRLLDSIDAEDTAYPNLTIAINTNLDVPDQLIDKMIASVNRIAPKVKQIKIFTSNEAKGKQSEYIRFGIDYDRWHANLDKVIHGLPENASATIMTTINILSLSTLDEFLCDMMEFRKKYNKSYTNNKLYLSINYLRWPPYLHAALAPDELKQTLINNLKEFVKKYSDGVFHLEQHYAVLNYDEIGHINSFCDLLDKTVIAEDNHDRSDFAKFIEEYDKRKGTNFFETFPELVEFYNKCKNG